MNKRTTFIFAMVLFLAATWVSCGVKSSYYQKQAPVPGAKWSSRFQPVFRVDVKDTTAKYTFYFLIRHDESYPNSNIWFRLSIKAPGDSVFRAGPRIQSDLADTKGAWQGRGMGGVWEHKITIPAAESPQLNHSGSYEIRMEQLMREDPLPSVLNVGLAIEQQPKKG